MFRIKKFALAAVALSALSLSVTGCFGDDSTDNPVTTTAEIKDQGVTGYAGAQDVTVDLDKGTGASFISIQGDANDPAGFFLSSGTKTADDEAKIDLCFFSMNGTAKATTGGTPTFVSPNFLGKTVLTDWAVFNKTIIVATTKAASSFTTIQSVKDVIATAPTSESAVAAVGAYAVEMTVAGAKKYAILNVTAIKGAGRSAEVTIRIIK